MANFLNKFKINSAVDDRSKFDLGCDHITTANWMEFNVAYNKELVPREKIDVNMETFFRMLPLAKPTFGRASVNNRAFFVPYRTVFYGWDDFITDAPHISYGAGTGGNGLLTEVPTIENGLVIGTFLAGGFGLTTTKTVNGSTVTASASNYDVYVYKSDANTDGSDGQYTANTYYFYTNVGRRIMKILNSLGYTFSWDVSCNAVYSALPLLCVARIYADWYWPSAYTDNSIYNAVMSILRFDSHSGSLLLTRTMLYNIFYMMRFVCYDSDYFVSAWKSPSAPSVGNFSPVTIASIDNGSSSAYNKFVDVSTANTANQVGSPRIVNGSTQGQPSGVSAINGGMTQYLMDALKKLTDYMKRHQLVGSRNIDRFLARFGVELKHANEDRSYYLGTQKVNMQIGDVMSTADTSSGTGGQPLGDYAGKGLGYGDGHFDYETNEYGQFIIISSIIPSVGWYQGVDRNVMHISKLDYFTPEFDSLGTQAISSAEMYVSQRGSDATGQNAMFNQIYGFIPRYAEYKIGHDRVTGDFRYNSMNTSEDAWYLKRDVTQLGLGTTVSNYQIDITHILQGADFDQYNRIMLNATDNADPFKMIYHFEVASWSPMKPLFENYEFEDKGKEVVEDVNGVKMN